MTRKSPTVQYLILTSIGIGTPLPSQTPSASAPVANAPLPHGWKRCGTKLDEQTLQHANGSTREWSVSLDNGKVAITRLPESKPPDDSSEKDLLPFKIEPKLTELGEREHLSDFDFMGSRTVAKIDDGWLVGFDGGEFGGGLYWFSASGSVWRKLSLARPPQSVTDLTGREFDADNVLGLEKFGNDFLAIEGLAHMGIDVGKIVRVHKEREGWRPSLFAKLGSAPQAYFKNGNEGWFILTNQGLLLFDLHGAIQKVGDLSVARWLYPNSMVKDENGVIYVGMRHFVARLIPHDATYETQILVPDFLPLFDPKSKTESFTKGRNDRL